MLGSLDAKLLLSLAFLALQAESDLLGGLSLLADKSIQKRGREYKIIKSTSLIM